MSGSQAEQTFTVLEKLASNNIDTFMGSCGEIFKNEIEVKNAAGDGFSHGSNGFRYDLFNGSMTQTLNSNIDRKRGKIFQRFLLYAIISFFIIQIQKGNE